MSEREIAITQSNNAVEALLAYPFLASIDQYYPGMSEWYVNTVLPGLSQGQSLLFLAKQGQTVVGMALAKAGDEKKLRCVRVHPAYTSHAIGIRLMDRVLETLQEPKPHCTVSEELLHQYSRIFVNRYGFALSHVSKGQYRPRKLEYHFN